MITQRDRTRHLNLSRSKHDCYLVFGELCRNSSWVHCNRLHIFQLPEGIGEPRPQLIIGLLKLSRRE